MSSVRKDVEDCFGILKKRFRILRVPSLLHSEKQITTMFKTCCILHNMLLDWDGHASMGQDDDHWIAQDKTDLAEVLENIRARREEVRRARNPNSRGPPTNPVGAVSNAQCYQIVIELSWWSLS